MKEISMLQTFNQLHLQEAKMNLLLSNQTVNDNDNDNDNDIDIDHIKFLAITSAAFQSNYSLDVTPLQVEQDQAWGKIKLRALVYLHLAGHKSVSLDNYDVAKQLWYMDPWEYDDLFN
jgi:hypothetical protein